MKYIVGECPECLRVIAASMETNPRDRIEAIDEFIAGGLSVREIDFSPDRVAIFDHAPGCSRKVDRSGGRGPWARSASGHLSRECEA